MVQAPKEIEMEKKIEHTPGPWFTQGEPSRLADGMILVGREGENLALVETRHGHASANAHLIAAAPELLDALERYLSLDYNGFAINSDGKITTPELWIREREEIREKAIAAIAKALGVLNDA